MKKTKIEQRVENAFNAFFDDESLSESNSLVFANNTDLFQERTSEKFTEKADVLLTVIKQVFLFFPGTLVLFTFILFVIVFTLNPSFSVAVFYSGRAWGILLVSAFMTMFGLGNIKNVWHLIIPSSIALLALLSGIVMITLGSVKFVEEYGMYLLPVALIVPFWAKGWVDGWDGEKIDG